MYKREYACNINITFYKKYQLMLNLNHFSFLSQKGFFKFFNYSLNEVHTYFLDKIFLFGRHISMKKKVLP